MRNKCNYAWNNVYSDCISNTFILHPFQFPHVIARFYNYVVSAKNLSILDLMNSKHTINRVPRLGDLCTKYTFNCYQNQYIDISRRNDWMIKSIMRTKYIWKSRHIYIYIHSLSTLDIYVIGQENTITRNNKDMGMWVTN